MAAIASTIGTARGKTHGSCLPWALKNVCSPFMSIVDCVCKMVATGLNAVRNQMSSPLLIPPCIPPL